MLLITCMLLITMLHEGKDMYINLLNYIPATFISGRHANAWISMSTLNRPCGVHYKISVIIHCMSLPKKYFGNSLSEYQFSLVRVLTL